MRAKILITILILSLFFLNACGRKKTTKVPLPPLPPEIKVETPKSTYLTKGSLYKEGDYFLEVTDKKAFKVGDIITIKIVETYQTTNTVSGKVSKNSNSQAGIGSILGLENNINRILPNANPNTLFSGSMSSATSGQGEISRQSKIVATITVRVVKVLPNGNLVIRGVRQIKRNNELEYITISGIVRPEDIEPDNSILSTKIADAYIEYSGKGPFSEATKGPGILTRLLNRFWIF